MGSEVNLILLLRKLASSLGEPCALKRSGITSWENWCRFVRLANSSSKALMKNARSLQFSLPSNFRLINPGANLFLVVQKEVSDDTSTKRVEVRLSGLCHPPRRTVYGRPRLMPPSLARLGIDHFFA